MSVHFAEEEVQNSILSSIWFIIMILFVLVMLKGSHSMFDWFSTPVTT